MSRIYARSLAGKEIVTVEGTVLGELENIVLDPETGKLVDLVVMPNSDVTPGRYREDGKLILIPMEAVRALKDYIVVEERKAQI